MHLYYNFVYLVCKRTQVLHTSVSIALPGSLSASKDDLFSEKMHFCAPRAGGAREAGKIMDRYFLSRGFQRGIKDASKPKNDQKMVPYVVKTHFRALRACGMCEASFSYQMFILGPKRFQ